MCAVGHALVDRGHAVLFMPTYSLVQELLAAKRNLELPRALRKLDHYAVLLLDDVGYIQQSPDEAEILFTLLSERYERRSVVITSNLIFAQWDRIFRDQMATAAAIDRLVHHSVLLEFDVTSFRTEHAKRRGKNQGRSIGGRLVKETTAQDASGATIARSADLRVVRFFSTGETHGSRRRPRIGIGTWSNDPEPCTDEEAVDAGGPVDAENAPTGPWKTADGFPQAPTAIIG